MSRPTTATIDLGALRYNLQRARAAAPRARIAAAVKADGYGHGLLRVARALEGADALAVACIEEALTLREGGITGPILLLEGVFEASELPLCARWGLDIALHHPCQLEMLEQDPPPAPL
ncbi:MAG: alanine racemase, partial [Candidatus Competibacteraceae bacterium]|nr:alanine racemase [Candidatus Competibacteraceae bacterium]